ncbi:anti-sigma factor family protein [Roseovarius sp. MS2]|uniref:anti-sigma factor family protein n=1 Tax=Roseovarius sp. MS2 TaxID=3390728 RepID=UPI003EDC79E1
MAWVDGGLDAEATRDVACHIAICPSCQNEVAALRAETDALRQALGSERAPAQLHARIATHLAAEERRSTFGFTFAALRPRMLRAISGTALAASLLLAAFILDFNPRGLNAPALTLDAIAVETTQDYRTFRASQRVLDVASDDSTETLAWLSARIDGPLPALSDSVLDYRLVGGRLCLLLGQRLGALTYENETGQITVYVISNPAEQVSGHGLDTDGQVVRHEQGNIGSVVWSQDGLVIALLSTLSDAEKTRFADAFRETLNTRFLEI